MLDHVHRIVAAPTIAAAWDLHCARMAEYGFDRLLYGFTRFRARAARHAVDRDDYVVLSNHDPAYLSTYLDRRLWADAPMIRWAGQADGAETWSWVQRSGIRLTEAERRVVEYNRSMGIMAGVTISFPAGIWHSKGSASLVARPGLTQDDVDAIWAEVGTEVYTLNALMHLKVLNLPDRASAGLLTPRQREVLEWAGQGKTMQDIATIMGLTLGTVEKHLRLAREALSVATTTEAVLKASFRSQIFTPDPWDGEEAATAPIHAPRQPDRRPAQQVRNS